MPRVSRAEADHHREAITEASARLFKEHGLKGVSVAELMGAAGLTHGGFYGHFESKDALAGVAVAHAYEQAVQRWQRRIAGKTADAARAALVESYLTPQSLKNVGLGCPTVALAGDVAREPAQAPIRVAYLKGLDDLVSILATVEPRVGTDTGNGAGRRAALADYATMVGALMLARATEGEPLSAQILEAVRERLLPVAASVPASPAPATRRRNTRQA
jgi:TetR/AcrR family transcriptional repressor of nem operon